MILGFEPKTLRTLVHNHQTRASAHGYVTLGTPSWSYQLFLSWLRHVSSTSGKVYIKKKEVESIRKNMQKFPSGNLQNVSKEFISNEKV